MSLKTLDKVMPKRIEKFMPKTVKKSLTGQKKLETLPSYYYLQNLMSKYQVKNLVNEDKKSFKMKIDEFLQLKDYEMEGFKDPEKQRDYTIKFRWGHNHDFGDFSLKGEMGEAHISKIALYIDRYKAIPRSLDGLKVLDIGCWTGGTSLLLAAMGAHVVAVEEVKKYVDCMNYLKYAFNIEKLEPKNLSLYECTKPDFQDSFDIVFFAGVLYHLTDPIIALRITFNCLKDGGICLLQTAATNSKKRILFYEGPTVFRFGDKEDLSRRGWNWLFPSPSALFQMMTDVGYSDVQVNKYDKGSLFAVGKRKSHVDMMRSGLSVRTIR